jgi:hypothetical protein
MPTATEAPGHSGSQAQPAMVAALLDPLTPSARSTAPPGPSR